MKICFSLVIKSVNVPAIKFSVKKRLENEEIVFRTKSNINLFKMHEFALITTLLF